MNYAAIDKGSEVEKVEIPAEWANIKVEKKVDDTAIFLILSVMLWSQ